MTSVGETGVRLRRRKSPLILVHLSERKLLPPSRLIFTLVPLVCVALNPSFLQVTKTHQVHVCAFMCVCVCMCVHACEHVCVCKVTSVVATCGTQMQSQTGKRLPRPQTTGSSEKVLRVTCTTDLAPSTWVSWSHTPVDSGMSCKLFLKISSQNTANCVSNGTS